MKTWIAVLVLLAGLGAGPATRPTQDELAIADLRRQVFELRQQIAEIRKELRAMGPRQVVKATQPVVAPAAPPDAILDAIAHKRVVAGMTDSQADDVLRAAGIQMNQHTEERLIEGERVVYRVWETGAFFQGYHLIVAKNGKVITVEH